MDPLRRHALHDQAITELYPDWVCRTPRRDIHDPDELERIRVEYSEQQAEQRYQKYLRKRED